MNGNDWIVKTHGGYISNKFINEKEHWYEYDSRTFGNDLKCNICGKETLLIERVYVYPNFKLHINDKNDYTKTIYYCECCKDKVKRPHIPKKPKWVYVNYAHKKLKIRNDETFYDEFERLTKVIDSRTCNQCKRIRYAGIGYVYHSCDINAFDLYKYGDRYAWECKDFKEI